MDALPRDPPQHPDHEWVNETKSRMDITTCHKVKFSFDVFEIQKEVTRRSHVAFGMFNVLAGWISNAGKAYDWIGSGGIVFEGRWTWGVAWQHCRAYRLDTSLNFSLPRGSLFVFGEATMEHGYIYEFSSLGFNSILIHRHGQI
jgi:hypothetical protein